MTKYSKEQFEQFQDVTIGPVRVTFEALFKPFGDDDNNEEPKYKVAMAIPKAATALLDTIRMAERKAGEAVFGADFDINEYSLLRDGDTDKTLKKKVDAEGKPVYLEHWGLSAKTTDVPVVLGGPPSNRYKLKSGEVKSGDYVHVWMRPFPYQSKKGGDGVTWILKGVLFAENGTPITAKENLEEKAKEMFGGLDGADLRNDTAMVAESDDWDD